MKTLKMSVDSQRLNSITKSRQAVIKKQNLFGLARPVKKSQKKLENP